MPQSLLIIHPLPIYAEGLAKILNTHKSIKMVTIRHSSKDAQSLIHEWIPDMIVLGIYEGDEEENTKLIDFIKRKSKKNQILLIAGQNQQDFVRKCLLKGINGFIYDYSSIEIFLQALNKALQFQVYMPDGFRMHPDKDAKNLNSIIHSKQLLLPLTEREKQILNLIAKGKTSKVIANELFISDQTVGVHRKNLYRKLGVNNSVSLMKIALEKSLIN